MCVRVYHCAMCASKSLRAFQQSSCRCRWRLDSFSLLLSAHSLLFYHKKQVSKVITLQHARLWRTNISTHGISHACSLVYIISSISMFCIFTHAIRSTSEWPAAPVNAAIVLATYDRPALPLCCSVEMMDSMSILRESSVCTAPHASSAAMAFILPRRLATVRAL